MTTSTAAAPFLDGEMRLYIDGAFVTTDTTFDTHDPATGQLLAKVPLASEADVDRAVMAARRAFASWRTTTPRARAALMHRLAQLIEDHLEELSTIEVLDNGKTLGDARGDVGLALATLRYYAEWTDKLHGEVVPNSVPGMLVVRKREPIGVVAAIAPWNFPFLELLYKIAPSLTVGCTVVGKPSSLTPLSALRLAQLIDEAGFPPGVVNIIAGPGDTVGMALVRHPEVNKIAFTGQTDTGKAILRAAADGIKRVTLELGGKSPIIVMPDADIEAAVTSAYWTTIYNQGQVCVSGSRLIVHESIADRFAEDLASRIRGVQLGHGLEPSSQMGSLISAGQKELVLGYIASAREQGANIIAGGVSPREKGLSEGQFVEATVLMNVQPEMRVAQEEIFGPVASILKWRTLDEAAAIANGTKYGLSAGVFSRDVNAALRMADLVDSGTVWVNTYAQFDVAVSFGGHKQSGLPGHGTELGAETLAHYEQTKMVWVNTGA